MGTVENRRAYAEYQKTDNFRFHLKWKMERRKKRQANSRINPNVHSMEANKMQNNWMSRVLRAAKSRLKGIPR